MNICLSMKIHTLFKKIPLVIKILMMNSQVISSYICLFLFLFTKTLVLREVINENPDN